MAREIIAGTVIFNLRAHAQQAKQELRELQGELAKTIGLVAALNAAGGAGAARGARATPLLAAPSSAARAASAPSQAAPSPPVVLLPSPPAPAPQQPQSRRDSTSGTLGLLPGVQPRAGGPGAVKTTPVTASGPYVQGLRDTEAAFQSTLLRMRDTATIVDKYIRALEAPRAGNYARSVPLTGVSNKDGIISRAPLTEQDLLARNIFSQGGQVYAGPASLGAFAQNRGSFELLEHSIAQSLARTYGGGNFGGRADVVGDTEFNRLLVQTFLARDANAGGQHPRRDDLLSRRVSRRLGVRTVGEALDLYTRLNEGRRVEHFSIPRDDGIDSRIMPSQPRDDPNRSEPFDSDVDRFVSRRSARAINRARRGRRGQRVRGGRLVDDFFITGIPDDDEIRAHSVFGDDPFRSGVRRGDSGGASSRPETIQQLRARRRRALLEQGGGRDSRIDELMFDELSRTSTRLNYLNTVRGSVRNRIDDIRGNREIHDLLGVREREIELRRNPRLQRRLRRLQNLQAAIDRELSALDQRVASITPIDTFRQLAGLRAASRLRYDIPRRLRRRRINAITGVPLDDIDRLDGLGPRRDGYLGPEPRRGGEAGQGDRTRPTRRRRARSLADVPVEERFDALTRRANRIAQRAANEQFDREFYGEEPAPTRRRRGRRRADGFIEDGDTGGGRERLTIAQQARRIAQLNRALADITSNIEAHADRIHRVNQVLDRRYGFDRDIRRANAVGEGTLGRRREEAELFEADRQGRARRSDFEFDRERANVLAGDREARLDRQDPTRRFRGLGGRTGRAGIGIAPGGIGGASLLAGGFIGGFALVGLSAGVIAYAVAWQRVQEEISGTQTALGRLADRIRYIHVGLRDSLGPLADFVAGNERLGNALSNLAISIQQVADPNNPNGQRLRSFLDRGADAVATGIGAFGGTDQRLSDNVELIGRVGASATGGFVGNLIARPLGIVVGRVAAVLSLIPGPIGIFAKGLAAVATAIPSLGTALGVLLPIFPDLRVAAVQLWEALSDLVGGSSGAIKGLVLFGQTLSALILTITAGIRALDTLFSVPTPANPELADNYAANRRAIFSESPAGRFFRDLFSGYDTLNYAEARRQGFDQSPSAQVTGGTFGDRPSIADNTGVIADLLDPNFVDDNGYRETVNRFTASVNDLFDTLAAIGDTINTDAPTVARRFRAGGTHPPDRLFADARNRQIADALSDIEGIEAGFILSGREEGEGERQARLRELTGVNAISRFTDPSFRLTAEDHQLLADQRALGFGSLNDEQRARGEIVFGLSEDRGFAGAQASTIDLATVVENWRLRMEEARGTVESLEDRMGSFNSALSSGLQSTFNQALSSVLDETESFGGAMRSLFRQIFTNVINELAFKPAAEGISTFITSAIAGFGGFGGGGGARHSGGPVYGGMSGRSYLVGGSGGLETLTLGPGAQGYVEPVETMGGQGATVVNNWYSNDTTTALAAYKEFEPEILRKAAIQTRNIISRSSDRR